MKAAKIKDKIAKLEKELGSLLGSSKPAQPAPKSPKAKKRKISAAGLARIRAAQKARWAKVKAARKS